VCWSLMLMKATAVCIECLVLQAPKSTLMEDLGGRVAVKKGRVREKR